MKNRKIMVIGMVMLVALLSAAIFGGIKYFSNDYQDEKITEFSSKIFAELDYEWDEHEGIQSFHVVDDERIMIQTYKYVYEFATDENGEEYCTSFIETYPIYEWNRESKTMREVLIEGYTVSVANWHENRVFFVGIKDGETKQASYIGEIGNGVIENIRQIQVENEDIQWIYKVSVSGNHIIFRGKTGNEGLVLYQGTIEGDTICGVKNLSREKGSDLLSEAVFVGDGTKMLAQVLDADSKEYDEEGRYYYTESDMLYMDLSDLGDKSSEERKAISFAFMSKNEHFIPGLCIRAAQDEVYYIDEENIVYKASLSAFIEKCIKEAEKEIEKESELEVYTQGDYSYDAYDNENFTSDHRNKSEKINKQGVYYEIFVRAFADSDGDGIGDFNGITEKLDYLKELGVDGLWLMPIHACNSYHGYDITDYTSLNSEYGTEEDFKKLLDEAHKREMKVIMDFVINHTSSEHPWFLSALEEEDSEYRNYYRWVAQNDSVDFAADDTSNWGNPVWNEWGDCSYYGIFGGHMPDLNYNNPAVREEIKAAAGKWLEMGVDGFRLDAAMHIYGANEFKQEEDMEESNLTWWNEFALYCESINPDVYLVGEAWQDDEVLEEYVQPFDTKFNFAFQQHLIEAVRSGTAVTESGENLGTFLQNILDTYDTVDTNYLDGVFGSNHDQERIMSTMQDVKKAKQVAAVYMTLPGNPFIYYGEELGMFGKKPDEMIRTPFLWGDASSYNTSWIEDDQNANTATLEKQMADGTSMYSFYKDIIAVRKAHDALTQGDYQAVDWKNDSIMAYTRTSQGETLLVLHNLSGSEQTLDLQGYKVKEVVFSTENDNKNPEGASIIIGGNESVILLVESN